MAGKTIPMSKLKQLIRLWAQGYGKRYMSRALGMSKNTVKDYLLKLEVGGWEKSRLLEMDEDQLSDCLYLGQPVYTDERHSQLQAYLEKHSSDLSTKGVTRTLLWEEYIENQPNGYRYTQFCHHLDQLLLIKNPSLPLQHKPGDKLYVDFAGRTVHYTDRETGEQIACQLFVACLPYSDYGFVLAVSSQRVEDFIHALVSCLSFLGGVPAAIVPDNLKSAVVRTCRHEPVINDALLQLANHYGTTVLPTRAAKPKDKALVENHVRLVYQRVLAPLRHVTFFSVQDLNKALSVQNNLLNQRRMQQKLHSRQELFLASEKSMLRPLPSEPFELEYQQLARVQKNNHVLLGREQHYYSVPYQYIGRKAKIIFTRSVVRICVDGKKVATHPRNPCPGRYSTIKEHLCSHHQQYLDRSPEYYIQRARSYSPVLEEFFTFIFQGTVHPEQMYRTCEGLLRLRRSWKESPQTYDEACRIALNNGQRSWRFVQQVLHNRTAHTDPSASQISPLPDHNNLRGANYYQ